MLRQVEAQRSQQQRPAQQQQQNAAPQQQRPAQQQQQAAAPQQQRPAQAPSAGVSREPSSARPQVAPPPPSAASAGAPRAQEPGPRAAPPAAATQPPKRAAAPEVNLLGGEDLRHAVPAPSTRTKPQQQSGSLDDFLAGPSKPVAPPTGRRAAGLDDLWNDSSYGEAHGWDNVGLRAGEKAVVRDSGREQEEEEAAGRAGIAAVKDYGASGPPPPTPATAAGAASSSCRSVWLAPIVSPGRCRACRRARGAAARP